MQTSLKYFSLLAFLLILLVGCRDVEEEVIKKHPLDNSLCNFNQGECNQIVADLTVSLSITPEHAPSELPLNVKLNFSQDVENVKFLVEGRDMFMGIIPGSLHQVSDSKTQYEGELIYGSCSSNYMVWRMFVSFDYQQQSQTVLFDFLADNQS
ncbi:hypothetical protein [Shewanella maritima]|uniref:hypothetical protein n=1 Tax=Shewanella maritima TaxID=2520507 RepID=UPI003734F434